MPVIPCEFVRYFPVRHFQVVHFQSPLPNDSTKLKTRLNTQSTRVLFGIFCTKTWISHTYIQTNVYSAKIVETNQRRWRRIIVTCQYGVWPDSNTQRRAYCCALPWVYTSLSLGLLVMYLRYEVRWLLFVQVTGDTQLRRPANDAAYVTYGRTNVSTAAERSHKPLNSQSVELRLSAWLASHRV